VTRYSNLLIRLSRKFPTLACYFTLFHQQRGHIITGAAEYIITTSTPAFSPVLQWHGPVLADEHVQKCIVSVGFVTKVVGSAAHYPLDDMAVFTSTKQSITLHEKLTVLRL
jgi:hypothetical protein